MDDDEDISFEKINNNAYNSFDRNNESAINMGMGIRKKQSYVPIADLDSRNNT